MRPQLMLLLVAAALAIAGKSANAGAPDSSQSSCVVTVTQSPVVPRCINNFEPDVIRLSPATNAAPPHDTATFSVTVRDAAGNPLEGALVNLFEIGTLNIVNGGSTVATTASDGSASIGLTGASSHGRVAVCADGVVLCEAIVRTPDIVRTDVVGVCFTNGTGASSVAGQDITHSQCGFLVSFGPAIPGDNDHCDLDCSGSVNGFDINGPSGVLRYFGDVGTTGARNSCP